MRIVDVSPSNAAREGFFCIKTSSRPGFESKNQWFAENHEVHSVEIDGPFLGENQFALRFKLDVTPKMSGQRVKMTEVGVYTVEGDKIVREEFYYNAP